MGKELFYLRSTLESMVACSCEAGAVEDCPRHTALRRLEALGSRLSELEDLHNRIFFVKTFADLKRAGF